METPRGPTLNTETPPSTTKKRQPRSPAQKLREILNAIKAANWTLSEFFYYLFQLEGEDSQPIARESQHKQMVTGMLNGTSKPPFGVIINLIHQSAGYVDYRKDDETSMDKVFQPGILPDSIKHAKPALTVWAVSLVSNLVRAEGQQMIRRETGLHLRASEKSKGGPNARTHAKHATWDAVDSFSLGNMQKIAEKNAPVLWEVVSSYVNPDHDTPADNQVVGVRRYRPQNVVHKDSTLAQVYIDKSSGVYQRNHVNDIRTLRSSKHVCLMPWYLVLCCQSPSLNIPHRKSAWSISCLFISV